jgi:hypothetical protein
MNNENPNTHNRLGAGLNPAEPTRVFYYSA